jgi:hypothetical protein
MDTTASKMTTDFINLFHSIISVTSVVSGLNKQRLECSAAVRGRQELNKPATARSIQYDTAV